MLAIIPGKPRQLFTHLAGRKMHEDCTACFGDAGGGVRQPAGADSNKGQDHDNGKPKQRES
jgi:hypothetical protein